MLRDTDWRWRQGVVSVGPICWQPNGEARVLVRLGLAEADTVVVHRLAPLSRRVSLDGAVIAARRVGVVSRLVGVAACRSRRNSLVRSILMRQRIDVLRLAVHRVLRLRVHP